MGLFKIRARRHVRSWISPTTQFLPKSLLERAAKVLLAAIRQEIDRERALSLGKEGVTLPKSPAFKASFRCPVVGQEIHIVSRWPTLEALLEGKDPFRMTWLTQQAGVQVVPMEGPQETTIFRTTPAHKEGAWMHPGFRKHEFLDRAIRRAGPQMDKIVAEGVAKILTSLPPV